MGQCEDNLHPVTRQKRRGEGGGRERGGKRGVTFRSELLKNSKVGQKSLLETMLRTSLLICIGYIPIYILNTMDLCCINAAYKDKSILRSF